MFIILIAAIVGAVTFEGSRKAGTGFLPALLLGGGVGYLIAAIGTGSWV